MEVCILARALETRAEAIMFQSVMYQSVMLIWPTLTHVGSLCFFFVGLIVLCAATISQLNFMPARHSLMNLRSVCGEARLHGGHASSLDKQFLSL